MEYRQYQVLKRKSPPASLKAEVTTETFEKSQAYARSKAKFGFFSGALGLLQNIAAIKYDLLPKFWSLSGYLLVKAAPILPRAFGGVITQSVIFFGVQQIFQSVLSSPLSYYSNFVLEEKYGFNKLTLGLWLSDKVKGDALSLVLGSPIMAILLKIFDSAGDSFVGYTTAFVLVVQLVFMTIFPSLIQPLFNKFTPLEDGELKVAIEKLATDQGFPLGKLYVIDGSKRSGHSNAYFTGLPWSKQIVLFDTLIDHSLVEETVAVLAHEIGHWKLSHLPKKILASQGHIFTLFSLFSAFIRNKSLYSSFGFATVQPTLIGFTLFTDIFSPVDSVLRFGNNLLSRDFEYQADAYAKKFGYSNDLAKALIKLLSENLSTMDADWLYSAYHHSHPILPERLEAIGYVSEEKIGNVGETKNEKVEEEKI